MVHSRHAEAEVERNCRDADGSDKHQDLRPGLGWSLSNHESIVLRHHVVEREIPSMLDVAGASSI